MYGDGRCQHQPTTAGSISGYTGVTVAVTCDVGHSGDGSATCETNGTITTANYADEPRTVMEYVRSSHSTAGSVSRNTGDTVNVWDERHVHHANLHQPIGDAVAVTWDSGHSGE